MVKLRSRLIRSPFSSSGEMSSSDSFDQQQQQSGDSGNNNTRRRNNNNNQHPSRRSQRLPQPNDTVGGGTAVERRPFESLESSSDIGTSSHTNTNSISNNSSGSLRQSFASPTGKRKPESRGITASIRRAKTAMFRMASSPMNSSSHHNTMGGGGGTVGNNNNDDVGNAMDTSDDSGGMVAAPGPSSSNYTSPTMGRTLHRTPSQEENVPPPMALLSPNCGTSYYAHCAAAETENNGSKKCRYSEDDVSGGDANAAHHNDMDVDATKNVLEWMHDDAPPELLPKLLSFCGSRQMNALSRVNKAWNAVMKDESVWRVLCEDTHKWSDGDEVPSSWAQFYKQNPCVPIDYDTVEAAFDSVSSGRTRHTIENQVSHRYREQRRSARILLHPGPYFLRQPLVANIIGDAEITIESIDGGSLSDPQHGMMWRQNHHKPSPSSSSGLQTERGGESLFPAEYHSTRNAASVDTRRPSSPTLRQIFGCGRRSSSSAALDQSSSSLLGSDHVDNQSEHRAKFHRACFQGPRPTALLCLESRRENEPIIRIRQGTVNIRGLKFIHYCEGTDIWNGNAAVQVQRAFGDNGRPLRVEPPSVLPTANVSDCDIMSLSGRGIVVIDGGVSHIYNTNVHTSAATGVYVGGAGSMATMTHTDVVDNGTGNTRNSASRGRGVARGHSGVYVEQGLAKMNDCNISGNSLTGISATSTVQARLHIEDSDIRGNGSDQMELPPIDSGRSVSRNNVISSSGAGRPRSRFLRESVILQSPRGREEPPTPQSPLEDDYM